VGPGPRQLLDLTAVVAAAVAVGAVLALAGLPSPSLFGALLAGLVRALAAGEPAYTAGPDTRGAN